MRLFGRRPDPLACQEFVELVTDYLEGTLPDAERKRVDAHLADCEGCAAYLEDTRRLIASLHAVPQPPADPHVRETLVQIYRDLRG